MLTPVKCQGLIFSEACLIEEYYFLYGIAALYRPATILEIGANTGLGSLSLWTGAHQAGGRSVHITTIERNPALIPYIKQNWQVASAPLNCLRIINEDSKIAVPALHNEKTRYDLCFIDGDHTYAGACADWNNTQKLTNFWLLHDSTQMSGVRRLVEQIKRSEKYDVFSFAEYPFGHQWNQKVNSYRAKNSIPGITIVKRKNICPHMALAADEKQFLKTVRGMDNTDEEIVIKT